MFSGFTYITKTRYLCAAQAFFRYPSIYFLILCGLLLASFCAPASAELDIIPVDQIHEGMKGYGKTVFQGLEITEFPVEVRGVLPGAGMSGDTLIVVKLTGQDAVARGGISQGMSGSPIYINGKLAGALALTFPMSDHLLGGVTPIESMIKAGEYQVGSTQGLINLKKPFVNDGVEYSRVRYGAGEPEDGVLMAQTVLAPVAVHGITHRGYALVKKLFENNGIEIAPITTAGSALKTGMDGIGPGSDIKPGSSVAVQLVRGDVDISAVGTVTAVDGDTVYMFGHPFFRKGSVKYLLADAHVIAIVNGADMPFKMSSTGLLRGEVLQDRGSALVGRLDSYPGMIPLEITAVDTDINRSKTIRVKIVPDEDIVANLVLMTVLETLDNTIDKIGEGTSNISFTVNATGYDGDITRENMYYDRFDIASVSLIELAQAVMMLYDNRFYESPITGVKVRAEISSKRSVAMIEKVKLVDWKSVAPAGEPTTTAASVGSTTPASASQQVTPDESTISDEEIVDMVNDVEYDDEADIPDDSVEIEFDDVSKEVAAQNDEENQNEDIQDSDEEEDMAMPVVMPGDKLTIGITLRPFRGETIDETLFMRVPQDMEPGTAHINVFSGGIDMAGASPGGFILDIKVEGPESRDQQDEGIIPEETPEDNFDDVIKDFLKQDMNNELIATIEKFGFDTSDDKKENDDKMKNGPPDQDGKAKKKTQWVLSGHASIKIKIGSPDGKEGFKNRKVLKSKIGSLKK